MSEGYQTLADIGVRAGQRVGDSKTICPKCSHLRKPQNRKEPCLSVKVKPDGDWVVNCWNCGWAVGKGTGETARSRRDYRRPNFQPAEPTDQLIDWFAKRGVVREVIDRYKLSATDVWMPGNERGQTTRVIAFPYLRNGEVINVKYRSADKMFRQEKHAEKIFYGLDDIEFTDDAIIVEGEIDKLSFATAGIFNAVSVPDGAPQKALDPNDPEPKKLEYLANCEGYFANKTRIYIATDADEPGEILAEELSRRLGRERCFRVHFPSDCKDANDTLRYHGGDYLWECIEYATPYPVEGIHSASDYREDFFRLYRDGRQRGIKTCWPNVNEYLSVVPGQLWVVTGFPGSGKSEWIDALCVDLVERQKWTVGLCSFENPVDEHFAKLAEKKIGAPFFDGPTARMTEKEVNDAIEWADRHFRFIRSDRVDDDPTIDWIIEKAKAAVLRDGINALVVDPFNYVVQVREKGYREDEYIRDMLRKLKKFASAHNVVVILIAHPQKPQPDKRNKPPGPYDIAGGAHFFNMADVICAVHRNRKVKDRNVAIHILKVRFKWVGQEGIANLEYDRRIGTYHDIGLPDGELAAAEGVEAA